nr:hypothetical protein [Tanacetum cinerariifolium]
TSSDSHATNTYTSMSSYEVIVNGYYGMPMDPLDPYPLPAAVSPTDESSGYITESEPEMKPEEEDGDGEKSEDESIEYPTSGGDDDANDDDSEEEEEEHLALTVPAPALYSSADILLRKRARFTTPTGGYEVGESSVAAARQIRPALTIADRRRADDRLIGKLRRERRYFRTLSTTYAQEVAHSRNYCTQIMDYCQSREVHISTLVTQMEALQRDVSTLQRQHIDDEDRLTRHIQHEHAQRDVAPEDGDSCS